MSVPRTSVLVVGVFDGQDGAVVHEAARFAQHFGAELVCAWVDSSRYSVGEIADGSAISMPMNPDVADTSDSGFPEKLNASLAAALDELGIAWSTRELAGDPARALAHFADKLNAVMIVVGTRDATIRGSLQEFFNGSTAAHLAHRQHRPVVVIPLSPVPFDEALPWEGQ